LTSVLATDVHCSCPGAYRRLYDAVYRRSIDKPEEFWAEAAEDIAWFKRWDKVLDDSQSPFTKWYLGLPQSWRPSSLIMMILSSTWAHTLQIRIRAYRPFHRQRVSGGLDEL